MKTKKITVSFKSTKRDIALLNVINELDDKSFYIKEAIRQYFKSEFEQELQKLNSSVETEQSLVTQNTLLLDRRKTQEEIAFEDRRKKEEFDKLIDSLPDINNI